VSPGKASVHSGSLADVREARAASIAGNLASVAPRLYDPPSRAVNRRTLLVVWRAIGGDLHDVRVVLGEPRIDARRICL
jgi:hypothetical protein